MYNQDLSTAFVRMADSTKKIIASQVNIGQRGVRELAKMLFPETWAYPDNSSCGLHVLYSCHAALTRPLLIIWACVELLLMLLP